MQETSEKQRWWLREARQTHKGGINRAAGAHSKPLWPPPPAVPASALTSLGPSQLSDSCVVAPPLLDLHVLYLTGLEVGLHIILKAGLDVIFQPKVLDETSEEDPNFNVDMRVGMCEPLAPRYLSHS